MSAQPFHAPPEGQRSLWILGGRYSWKALGAQTDGDYSLCEVQGPRGFAIPVHFHERENEGFLVTEGTVTLVLGDAEVRLQPGAFGFAPAGVHHAFRLDSVDAHLLLLITPGASGHEAMFEAMGQPAETEGLSPPLLAPPDPGALSAIAASHGTVIVGPPPQA